MKIIGMQRPDPANRRTRVQENLNNETWREPDFGIHSQRSTPTSPILSIINEAETEIHTYRQVLVEHRTWWRQARELK